MVVTSPGSSRAIPRRPQATQPRLAASATSPVSEWPGTSWKTSAPKTSATLMSRTLTRGMENAIGAIW